MNTRIILGLALALASGTIQAQRKIPAAVDDARLLVALEPHLRARAEFAEHDTTRLRAAIVASNAALEDLYARAYAAYLAVSGGASGGVVPPVIKERMKEELNWAIRFHQYDTADAGRFQGLMATKPSVFLYLPYMLQAEQMSAAPGAVGTSGALASSFGINASTIVDGITAWALERAEEELMQAFLRGWLDRLNEDRYLKLMTPSTLTLINSTEVGTLLTQGDLWKAAFQEDLDACPTKLDSLVVLILKEHKKVRANKTDSMAMRRLDEVGSAALVFGDLYRGLTERKDLEMLIATSASALVDSSGVVMPITGDTAYSVAQRALLGVSVLLDGTRYTQSNKYLHLDPHEIFAMDQGEFDIYWKYLCVTYGPRLRPAFNISDAGLADLAVNSKVVKAREQLMEVAGTCEALARLTRGDGTGAAAVLDEAAIADYLDLAMDLVGQGLDLSNVIRKDGATARFINGMGPLVLEQVRAVSDGATSKQYGRVVNGVIDLTQLLVDSLAPGDEKLLTFMAGLNKYGGFMVDMLEAKTSDDVKSALDKVTLGVGGYRVKQSSRFSGMVSLYPGAFFGMEKVYLDPGRTDGESHTDAALGAFLPIGVSLSAGTNSKCIPSVGLYLQVVDLGAALFYRLDAPDSVSTVPAYSFDMLLSPGGYFTFQLGRSPVTLGLGANLTPRLRTVTDANNLTYQASTLRYGAFIGVDVAAFQLFASKRKFGSAIMRYGK